MIKLGTSVKDYPEWSQPKAEVEFETKELNTVLRCLDSLDGLNRGRDLGSPPGTLLGIVHPNNR